MKYKILEEGPIALAGVTEYGAPSRGGFYKGPRGKDIINIKFTTDDVAGIKEQALNMKDTIMKEVQELERNLTKSQEAWYGQKPYGGVYTYEGDSVAGEDPNSESSPIAHEDSISKEDFQGETQPTEPTEPIDPMVDGFEAIREVEAEADEEAEAEAEADEEAEAEAEENTHWEDRAEDPYAGQSSESGDAEKGLEGMFKKFGEMMGQFGKHVEKNAKNWETNLENLGADFEKRMEHFGKHMEHFGETYGKRMEAWGEAYGKKMETWGEEYGKKMEAWGEEYGKKMDKWSESFDHPKSSEIIRSFEIFRIFEDVYHKALEGNDHVIKGANFYEVKVMADVLEETDQMTMVGVRVDDVTAFKMPVTTMIFAPDKWVAVKLTEEEFQKDWMVSLLAQEALKNYEIEPYFIIRHPWNEEKDTIKLFCPLKEIVHET